LTSSSSEIFQSVLQDVAVKRLNQERLFSAGDIVNFLECEYHTYLDLIDLQTPLPRTETSEELGLIQAKGEAHESEYAKRLKTGPGSYADIVQASDSIPGRIMATMEAMRSGVDIIYQPSLKENSLFGAADFFRKVPKPSNIGPFSYEVIDTKLALNARTRFVIQLAYYSRLLSSVQGADPDLMHVVLGDQTEKSFACKDYTRYLNALLERFLQRKAGWSTFSGCTFLIRVSLCSSPFGLTTEPRRRRRSRSSWIL